MEPCEARHVGRKEELAPLRLLRAWSLLVNQIGLFMKHGQMGLVK